MWFFYILAGILTASVTLKLIRPLLGNGTETTKGDRALALTCMTALPLCSLIVYLLTGRPDLPGQPRIIENISVLADQHSALLAQRPLETLATINPDDIGALLSLAQINVNLKHYPQAISFYNHAIAIAFKRNDARLRVFMEKLAQVQVMAANGIVGEDAKRTCEAVLILDAQNPVARYYRGLYKAQHGDPAAAMDEWHTLLKDGYPDAWWKKLVRQSIADTKATLQRKKTR
jgi:cytochrome c-type biogenesis protein CcmH